MLQRIKNILKKFLPPPIKIFNREIERILKAIKNSERCTTAQQNELVSKFFNLENKIADSERCTTAQQNELVSKFLDLENKIIESQRTLSFLEQEFNQFKEKQSKANAILADLFAENAHIFQETKDLQKAIPNKTVYWSNPFEKRVVSSNWGDITAAPDFEEKFVRLTSGMDEKSVQSIIRILLRQKQYLNSDNKTFDFFTREEQEQLRLLKENFYNSILKVSDNLYAYKNYLLPTNHFEPSVFYYKHGIDKLNTFTSVKGKAIIDVGGYIGDSVVIFSELEPSAIYSFEAVPENYVLLQKTVELNRIPNVIAENMALGAKSGTTLIHTGGSCSTSIKRSGITYYNDIEVPVTTLDEYVEKCNIQVGLIKVDIEGGEPGFLEGAKKTICSQKPIILLSIYHNAHDFFELKPLIESWNLGYKFKIHKPVLENTTSETLLLAEME